MTTGVLPVLFAALILAWLYETNPTVGGWLVLVLVLGAVIAYQKRQTT